MSVLLVCVAEVELMCEEGLMSDVEKSKAVLSCEEGLALSARSRGGIS